MRITDIIIIHHNLYGGHHHLSYSIIMATNEDIVHTSKSLLGGYIEDHFLTPRHIYRDPMVFLAACGAQQEIVIRDCMQRMGPIILWQSLHVNMYKDGKTSTSGFYHPRHNVFPSTDLKKLLPELNGVMLNNLDTYNEKGSGWKVDTVVKLEMNVDPLPCPGEKKRRIKKGGMVKKVGTLV